MGRTAQVKKDSDGKPKGVGIWLDEDDLEKLGITSKDVSVVQHEVNSSGVQVTSFEKTIMD